MCKISVIIPMYNAEPFIRQCLQSVIGQTYRNLEILVIDDGSTDRGAEICQDLCMTDKRIQVHSLKNGGVSRARNHGLDIASGEYIFFLDSDDALHPLLLEEMMGQVQRRHAEMVFCNCARMNDQEIEDALNNVSVKDDRPIWQTAEGPEAEEWFHITYSRELSGVSGLVSRMCIGDIRFDENLTIGEDTLFMYKLFCQQIRTSYSPCPWYYYRMHPVSASHTAKALFKAQYFDCNIMIRDSEFKKGNLRFALKSEEKLTVQMRDHYAAYRKRRDKASCIKLKEIAVRETKSTLFKSLSLTMNILIVSCFLCHFNYIPYNGTDKKLLEWKEASGNERK